MREIIELGLPMGQRKLLLAALRLFKDNTRMPAVEKPADNIVASMPDPTINAMDEGQADADDNVTLQELRRQQTTLDKAGRRLDDLIEAATPINSAVKPKKQPVSYLDPRSILTMKAMTRKAVHVTAFLSEKAKRRRQGRRRDLVLKTGGDDEDRVVLQTDDNHPYAGIYIEEWGAANCRVLNQLLISNHLQREDLEFNLAYTAKIFEFAEKYEWTSVLDFDYHYRELQAEDQFSWGTFAPQMELQLLVPKRRVGPPTAVAGTGRQNQAKTEECKIFKARNSCPFGAACIYNHVRGGNFDARPSWDQATPKTSYARDTTFCPEIRGLGA